MSKDMYAKMGMFGLLFLVLLFFIGDYADIWYTIDYNLRSGLSLNNESLYLLWEPLTVNIESLVTATLLQALVLFAALLGANLQFTPTEDDH